MILILALIVVGVAWYKGWFTVENNPETGKNEVKLHTDKFKTDKDAFVKTTGEACSPKPKTSSPARKPLPRRPSLKTRQRSIRKSMLSRSSLLILKKRRRRQKQPPTILA